MFRFRAMTPKEIAQRDAKDKALRSRLSKNDGDVFWRAQTFGILQLHGYGDSLYDVSKNLWDAGYAVVRLEDISEEAVVRIEQF